MLYLGCHLSASGGNCAMVKTALSIGANTFAFFTRNPRGSKAKQEDPADAAKAVAMLEENQFGPLVAHGAYFIPAVMWARAWRPAWSRSPMP